MVNRSKIELLQKNIEQAIKGKAEVVKMAIVTLLARGHLLLEDIPGVGKTTLAHSLARSLNSTFKRIQFTSDLLPSDIIGVSVYNQQKNEFDFKKGPIFSNIILADEINRTSPKTQSSLLEAMNECQVTVDNETYRLPEPFMVIATQNPMEYHGTFPLPESQLDRFMMRLSIGYPAEEDEKQILLTQRLVLPDQEIFPVLSSQEILELQMEAERVTVDESLIDYLLSIVSATRASELLGLGVSPRGSIFLHKTAKALAFTEGRDYCLPDDIKRLAPFVFSHRVIINTRLESFGKRGEDAEKIIEEIVEGLPVPI
ncbi:MAG TPA: MoxR family ATPase [Nitrospiria bacterium]|nr:MoxR family ATPase [Nitrospiria bacterium]